MKRLRNGVVMLAALVLVAPPLASNANAETLIEQQLNSIYEFGVALISGSTVTKKKTTEKTTTKKKTTKEETAKKRVTKKR
jgi:hypothetical protein